MQLQARLIRRITADPAPPDPEDPTDPGSTRLVDENWDNGGDGENASVDTTSATSFNGSGTTTLTHSQAWSREGGTALLIDGIDDRMERHEFTATGDVFVVVDFKHGATPGEDAYVFELYAANGTTIAARWAVTAAGKVYLQDGTTGTGTGDDLSALTLSTGGEYVAEYTGGHGAQRLAIWPLSAYSSHADTDAWDILTATLTETSYSAVEIGLANAITGTTAIVGNVVNQSFDGATTGSPDSTTMPGWTFSGTGALAHSTTHTAEGAAALRVNTTGSRIARKTGTASRTVEYGDVYFYYGSAPGGTKTSWGISPRLGDNSAAAFQLGIDIAGKLRGRDSTNGTGGAEITATSALSAGLYRLAWNNVEVPGSIRFRYYTGANVSSTVHANAVQTCDFTTVATNFADPQIGQMASLDGAAADIWWDRLKIDTTGEPTPIGGGTGSPLTFSFDRLKIDSASMPARASISTDPPPPPVTGKLLPPAGKVWFGSSTPVLGGSGTSTTGLAQFNAVAGDCLKILHFYIAGWNGVFSAAQKAMLTPAGGPRKIPFVNIKPGQGLSMAQIATGGADSELNVLFGPNGVKSYPHTVMIGLWHEWDNNYNPSSPTTQQKADYVAMWRYVVQKSRDMNVTNVVWVWIQTGYSSWRADYPGEYPGDDVVDWIGYDPYGHTGDGSFSDIVNETDNGAPTWTGFYNWATTARTGFSGAKPIMMSEWGLDFREFADAPAATWLSTVVPDLADYPQLRALIWWNGSVSAVDSQIQRSGFTTMKAAFAAMAANTIFDIDTAAAP